MNNFLCERYYLAGTIYGLLLVPIVALGVAGPGALTFLQGFPSIVAGYVGALATASILDPPARTPNFLRTIAGLLSTFLSGVVLGCFVNFLVFRASDRPFGTEFFDWFCKPFVWLSMFGVPAALFVGGTYFLVARKVLPRGGSPGK
jgi:hypothetical protein